MLETTPREAQEEIDIRRCFQVMKQLRPHFEEVGFVEQVQRQQKFGYRLVYIEMDGIPVAAAGYRISEFLAWGKTLYVDDLITDQNQRGKGFGSQLLNYLMDIALNQNCDQFHLDSGYQRNAAHRLYLNHGLELVSHHFAKKLKD
jgi:GNAT superfamily N-acetyltransferase